MIRRFWLAGWLVTAAVAQEAPPKAEPVPGVPVEPPNARASGVQIVMDGRLRVVGGDAQARGGVLMAAKEIRDDLLALTGERDDELKIAVTVMLHGQPGDPLPPRSVAMRRLLTDAGNELLIDVHLSHGVDVEAFRHTLTAALVYERCLRKPDAPGEDIKLRVPPWLVEGLRESASWRLKRPDRKLYEALSRHGGLYKLDELFAVDEAGFEGLDGAMRAAFRGSSGALVMALAEQPEGKRGMIAFLAEVPSFEGEMPTLLRKHFPDLNLSEKSLSKWLSLKLADLATPNATEALGVMETETALDQALQLNFRDAQGASQRQPVEAWSQLEDLKEHERAEAVRQAQDSLVRLSYRCFPAYRPLLKDYQEILTDIARNRTKSTDTRLAELKTWRNGMIAKCERARDYMDWFEITRARETSGAFEDYQRLKARLEDNPVVRDDHIASYLDLMNRIFARKTERRPAQIPGVVPMLSGGQSNTLPDLPPNLPQHLPIDERPIEVKRTPGTDVPIELPPQ